MTAVLVAGAGACGVLARYGITQAVGASSALWSVLAINVVGSFFLGALVGAGASSDLRLVAGVGFLGGFTTFSTFSLDVFADLEAGRPGRAVVYVLLSVGLGVGAAAAGWALARA
ncbi:MAG: CrcB family protein [Actinomycetota bacterium]|nr:CrcB family protein [Actinomycetota bacterium]